MRLLWHRAATDLRDLGAEVVEVDFPAVSNYEEDRPSADGLVARGLVPPSWRAIEGGTITAMALDEFLRVNDDPELNTWADVDGDTVFPIDTAPLPVWITRARGGFDWQRLAELVKQGLPRSYDDVPGLDHLLRGLERARKEDLEEWMLTLNLDAIVFPAAGDVGRADLFTRAESMEAATRNGVVYSNGNRVIRHLGIPTVTVPMGCMADTQMPVGLTFAGPAYSDDRLIDVARAYEQASKRRVAAFLTPSLPSNQIVPARDRTDELEAVSVAHEVEITAAGRAWRVVVRVLSDTANVQVWADGHILRAVASEPGVYAGNVSRSRERLFDEVLVLVKGAHTAAQFTLASLPAQQPSKI
ncbi:hypothetical protein [Microbacterium marmarense]|uniref:Amidase n=1 Tax=Microbacterium marmarense TaxID=3122051 RepID=A0ABU8LQG9_9MICO